MKERCPHMSFLYSKECEYLLSHTHTYLMVPFLSLLITYVFICRVQLVRQGQLLKTYKVNFSTEGVSIAAKGIAIILGALHILIFVM